MSEITPVKPGVLSRIASISWRIEPSERLWMMRPSCSVIAETAAHDRHREPDHVPGGDLGVAIGRVRGPGVGQVVDAIHLRHGQRDRRRGEPDVAVAVALDQRPGVAGIALPVQHAGGARIGFGILFDLLVRRQADDHVARLARGALVGGVQVVGVQDRVVLGHLAEERDAADVVQVARAFPRGDPVGHLDDGALGVAVEQQVGLGVGQDRAADLLGPVVEVGDAAERRLDAAQDDRHVLERLAAALGVDQGAAVGSLAALTARRIGVVAADPAVGRVAVDHRVHVAAGDAEEDPGLAQRLERLGRLPVGLRDDADPEALGLQQPADDRHAEAGVVDVGVAGHQDDVAGVPAQRVHLGPAHRQERRRPAQARLVAKPGNRTCFGDFGVHSAPDRRVTR
jgi:hypothetical protein